MSNKGWPYCEHPECHNNHTSHYWTSRGTTNVPGGGSLTRVATFGPGEPTSGGHRWCRSHALINEGWAVG